MNYIYEYIRKYKFSLVFCFLSLLLFIFLMIKASYPTMYVDESLYVGAALEILNGDILLRNYWFDKPFMQFFWIIPGIIILGSNIVGFSLSGILCSCISFFKIHRIFSNSKNNILITLTFILFFTNPFHMSYFSSAMAEPFLLISIIFSLHAYFLFLKTNNREQLAKSYFWFSLGFCVKQAILMLLPMYIGVLLKEKISFKRCYDELKFFLIRTKYIWALAIIYQVSNKSKFAAITWFSKLTSQKVKHTLFEHFTYWSKTSFLSQRSTLLAIFILIVLSLYAYWIFKKIKSEKSSLKNIDYYKIDNFNDYKVDLFIFFIPLLLHFIGISLSNAKHLERYMFIYNIQLYIVLARIFYITPISFRKFITLPLLILIGINIYHYKDEELDHHRKKGESLRKSQYIIPENSILHTRLKWHSYPYNQNYFIDSCVKKSCFYESHRGIPFNKGHFFIDHKNDFNIYEILPLKSTKVTHIQKLQKDIWEIFKRRLKLPTDFKIKKVQKVQNLNQSTLFNISKDTEKWNIVYGNNDISLDLTVSPLITAGKFNDSLGPKDQYMINLLIEKAFLSYKKHSFNIMTLLELSQNTLSHPISILKNFTSQFSKFHYIEIVNNVNLKYIELQYE